MQVAPIADILSVGTEKKSPAGAATVAADGEVFAALTVQSNFTAAVVQSVEGQSELRSTAPIQNEIAFSSVGTRLSEAAKALMAKPPSSSASTHGDAPRVQVLPSETSGQLMYAPSEKASAPLAVMARPDQSERALSVFDRAALTISDAPVPAAKPTKTSERLTQPLLAPERSLPVAEIANLRSLRAGNRPDAETRLASNEMFLAKTPAPTPERPRTPQVIRQEPVPIVQTKATVPVVDQSAEGQGPIVSRTLPASFPGYQGTPQPSLDPLPVATARPEQAPRKPDPAPTPVSAKPVVVPLGSPARNVPNAANVAQAESVDASPTGADPAKSAQGVRADAPKAIEALQTARLVSDSTMPRPEWQPAQTSVNARSRVDSDYPRDGAMKPLQKQNSAVEPQKLTTVPQQSQLPQEFDTSSIETPLARKDALATPDPIHAKAQQSATALTSHAPAPPKWARPDTPLTAVSPVDTADPKPTSLVTIAEALDVDRATAPDAPRTTPTAPQPRIDLARSVAQQMTAAVGQSADGTIDVRLSPEDLGRVRLALTPSDLGMTVSITTERPETLDLVRRHIDLFAQDLRQSGFQNLAFTFGQGDQRNATASAFMLTEGEPAADETEVAGKTTAPKPLTATGRLDLRL